MNSHLVILSKETPLALPDKHSIQLTDQNPLFHDDEMYSLNMQVPLEGNRHIFKNVDDTNAETRMIDHEHTPMRIIADGVPFRSGVQVVAEDEEIRDSVSFNIDAQLQSFRDLIGNLTCRDVQIPAKYRDHLLIGEKIGNVKASVTYNTSVTIKHEGKKPQKDYGSVGENTTEAVFEPQALGFSYPGECYTTGTKQEAQAITPKSYQGGNILKQPKEKVSYINTDQAYPNKLFCNARVCYKHYDKGDDGKTSSDIVQKDPGNEDENRGPLWVLDAKRPQSGICFYLLFFLDCLFEQLGVQFDKSALMKIGDMQRLCFFTTLCKYDLTPWKFGSLKVPYKESDLKFMSVKDIDKGFFSGSTTDKDKLDDLFKDVNTWLDSRGCGGQLKFDTPRDKSMNDIVYYETQYILKYGPNGTRVYEEVPYKRGPQHKAVVGQNGIQSITCQSTVKSASFEASILRMYANNENFPKESVSSVIDSLEKQFGIKFAYDYEQKKVTAYLLRDIFRDNSAPRPFHATITEMIPVTEKITGIKVGYSVESDSKEQRNNIRDNIKNYDTTFDYIEYLKDRTITDKTYRSIIGQVYNDQMNVFVDLTTGNKYRVKISSDYTNAGDMEPRLFEVAGGKGVELGDCSPLNEDFVIEMLSDFLPVPMNDTNYRRALESAYEPGVFFTNSETQPSTPGTYNGNVIGEVNGSAAHTIMAAFVDEDMEHEFIEQIIKNPLSSSVADFYVVESLKLLESYDPSGTDDGNSPLQNIDWGLAIAIMRGGGPDSTTQSYEPNYDGFGNSKWRTVVGEYALTTDSIDPYGNVYDYNGTWPGIGNEERFSLKVRSWVQPEWAEAPLVVNDPLVKNRGWLDTFLIEYCHFLLHRKKFRVTALCSVAQLADVPNHWKEWWDIDGKRCLIDKMEYSIDTENGLSEVTMDIYAI